MKKFLLVALSMMIVVGAFTYVFATDGGMDDPRPMGGMKRGGMMGGQKGQGSMMMHGDMITIHKDMRPSAMKEMSRIMIDMFLHIKYMAEIMSKGNASQDEMNHMMKFK
jgi:hypothetical protein